MIGGVPQSFCIRDKLGKCIVQIRNSQYIYLIFYWYSLGSIQ